MKLFFSLVGLMLLASTVQADSVNTIQLRNRPAAEIIPIVKPILGADEAITGQGFKIFLRSSAATLAEIKGMIETLDSAAKILQISVFQGNTRGLKALGLSGNIRVESDGARVGVGTNRNSGGDGGASIKYGTGNASGDISGSSTRIRLEDSPIHQLRVTEGSEAYIETGAQIPFFFRRPLERSRQRRGRYRIQESDDRLLCAAASPRRQCHTASQPVQEFTK